MEMPRSGFRVMEVWMRFLPASYRAGSTTCKIAAPGPWPSGRARL